MRCNMPGILIGEILPARRGRGGVVPLAVANCERNACRQSLWRIYENTADAAWRVYEMASSGVSQLYGVERTLRTFTGRFFRETE
jgi:hypothetical protein